MHHFGVLVPSTNSIVEIEYGRLLPMTLQVHVARIPLLSRGSSDTDVDYQSRLLGTAKVEVVALAQTGATLSDDDYA
jgi:maleate cis-trans isomerase